MCAHKPVSELGIAIESKTNKRIIQGQAGRNQGHGLQIDLGVKLQAYVTLYSALIPRNKANEPTVVLFKAGANTLSFLLCRVVEMWTFA